MCKKACSDILPHFQALPHQNLPLPVPPSPFFPCVLDRCRQVSSVSVIPGQTSEQALYWATALDPIRLFQQVEQLQQAIFRYAVSGSAPEQQAPLPSLLKFDLEGHAITSCLLEGMGHDEGSVSPHNNQKPQESVHVLDWRRTSKDPFAGQWEQILFWVQTNPTCSGGDIFRELQSLFPGRYRPQHLRTLQRGLRRIRAYVLTTREEPQQTEVIHAEVRPPHDTALASTAIVSLPSRPMQSVAPSSRETSTHSSHSRFSQTGVSRSLTEESSPSHHRTRNPILSASPSQGQASSENAGMASNGAASVTRLSAAGTPSPSRQSDH